MLAEVSLDGLWRFKGYKECDGEEQGAYRVDLKVDDWLLAEAPLTAHTNLLANKLIPDPFVGNNERMVQWVNESEWWYRKEVDLTTDVIDKDIVELVFASLDTFATIWVNDVKVGEANNMFTSWRFNIKKAAKAGRNIITIRFKPVYKVASELEQKHKHKYVCLSADNFSARPYVRKAQYQFGWDWGPTLPTAGIWRSAKVVAYNKARLGYIAGIPIEVSKQTAKVKLSAEIHAAKKETLNLTFALVGFGQKLEQEIKADVSEGRNFADCTITVNEPKLWWPKGYGEPFLYDASVKVYSASELLDASTVKVGIRSIKLIQEPDDEGKSFIFNINGLNIFCKGANWVPADSFLPKVNYEQYNKLLSAAAEANFNMLRVWGGGVYEADDFYALCDSLGIMVWQDFMYVCAGYPEEEWFLREAEREAMEAVLRLRGHPSIVLWCGNNENQWLHNILWKARDKVERLYGSMIYEQLLLQVIQTLDTTRPYRPSTPFGGEDSSGRHEGDRHNWEVWSQGKDYPAYLEDNGRFISEFGWQALPSMELLNAYLEKQDLNIGSSAFKAHEKQTGGLELLKTLLAAHYPVPEDLRLFALYSQLNQADALKTAIYHWRSRMFKTSGTLIWQFNDCWPVISWSLIDYSLNPKAAYFAVKRAFEPVIAPLIVKDGKIQAYVVNESANDLELDLAFEVFRFSGESLQTEKRKVNAPKYSAVSIFETAYNKLPMAQDLVMTARIEQNGAVLYEDSRTLLEPKDLQLPTPNIQVDVGEVDTKTFEISLQTNVYAKAVYLQVQGLKAKLSDNFFDLLPKRKKTVTCRIKKDMNLADFKQTLTWQTYPYTKA